MLKQFHSALNSNQCQISSHSIVAEPSQLTQDYHITFQCSQHIIFACVASLLFTLIHRAEQLARSLLSYTYLHAISLDGTTSYHSNSCWDLASPKNTHLPAKCAQLTRATFLQVNREISATLTELYVPYLGMHHTGPPCIHTLEYHSLLDLMPRYCPLLSVGRQSFHHYIRCTSASICQCSICQCFAITLAGIPAAST